MWIVLSAVTTLSNNHQGWWDFGVADLCDDDEEEDDTGHGDAHQIVGEQGHNHTGGVYAGQAA